MNSRRYTIRNLPQHVRACDIDVQVLAVLSACGALLRVSMREGEALRCPIPWTDWRLCGMPFAQLCVPGNLRRGSIAAAFGKCVQPSCQFARRGNSGRNRRIRLTHRIAGQTMAETFDSLAMQGMAQEGGRVPSLSPSPRPAATQRDQPAPQRDDEMPHSVRRLASHHRHRQGATP